MYIIYEYVYVNEGNSNWEYCATWDGYITGYLIWTT